MGIIYFLLLTLGIILTGLGLYHSHKKLPEGLSLESPEYYADDVHFFRDLTWIDREGNRQHDQQIFQEILSLVRKARRMVLLDMFLYNDLAGRSTGTHRQLSGELTDALVAQKKKYPDLEIILVTDPINMVYGGMKNPYFKRLKEGGCRVIVTNLDRLRDSNPLYSSFWRLFIRPFGTGEGTLLPNPFGAGRVSVRSYLRMFNFKANHRKVVIADQDDKLIALVTSANPHDGSSSHGNVAVGFSGPAVQYLMKSEEAVAGFSDGTPFPDFPVDTNVSQDNGARIRVLTEGKIERAILTELDKTAGGDLLVIVLFYLSDRDIVLAIKRAHQRGARIQVILDPNKDAFGRTKNGMPNRQVAAELVDIGIPVRWGNTHGEQLHSKMMLFDRGNGESSLILGSANLTRRNLNDLNLETNVLVHGRSGESIFQDTRSYFELLWKNDGTREFSVDYSAYADKSFALKMLYRLIEATGICTF